MKRQRLGVVALAIFTSIAINCRRSHEVPSEKEASRKDKPIQTAPVASCTKPDDSVHFLKVRRGRALEPDGICRPPCPSNSPVVNAFPVNGLDTAGSGQCNPEGVQVVPGSAHGSGCGSGSLVFDADKRVLAVKTADGKLCAGEKIAHTSFTVQSFNNASVVFTIDARIELAGASGQKREAYRILASTGSAGSNDQLSVCDSRRSDEIRMSLGLGAAGSFTAVAGSATDPGTEPVPSLDPDYAIALPDPLFSATVREIAADGVFFNLACVNDALAKRTLDGIVKEKDSEDVQIAALRMMTATYCDRPRTARNMKFHFDATHGNLATDAESWWTATRAMCLQNARLRQLGDYGQVTLGPDLIPSGCAKGSDGSPSPCKTWTDWEDQVIAECKYDKFKPVPTRTCDPKKTGDDFRSYVPARGQRLVNFEPSAGDVQDTEAASDR